MQRSIRTGFRAAAWLIFAAGCALGVRGCAAVLAPGAWDLLLGALFIVGACQIFWALWKEYV